MGTVARRTRSGRHPRTVAGTSTNGVLGIADARAFAPRIAALCDVAEQPGWVHGGARRAPLAPHRTGDRRAGLAVAVGGAFDRRRWAVGQWTRARVRRCRSASRGIAERGDAADRSGHRGRHLHRGRGVVARRCPGGRRRDRHARRPDIVQDPRAYASHSGALAMITIRPVESLHHVDGGWFRACWHFSFDDVRRPREHLVRRSAGLQRRHARPGRGLADAPASRHRGHHLRRRGDVRARRLAAATAASCRRAPCSAPTLGSGMEHSEGNASQTEPMRFIQMWIIPSDAASSRRSSNGASTRSLAAAVGCRSSCRPKAMADRCARTPTPRDRPPGRRRSSRRLLDPAQAPSHRSGRLPGLPLRRPWRCAPGNGQRDRRWRVG